MQLPEEEEELEQLVMLQRGLPFAGVDTDHMPAEPLHMRINLVRSHFGYALLLAKRGAVPGLAEADVLAYMKSLGLERPMMSWDASAALDVHRHCAR